VARFFWVIGLWASSAFAQAPAQRCLQACARYLTRSDVACHRCIYDPEDPAAWMGELTAVPKGALADDDWVVRWGALRLEASLGGSTLPKRLAKAIAASSGAERVRTCLTAVHAAGEEDQLLRAFLAPAQAGSAAGLRGCQAVEDQVRRSLETSFFSLDPLEGPEALLHASVAFGVAPARLLLDAMRTRPESVDRQAAELLLASSIHLNQPAGRALLDHARANDAPQVNRLLTYYAAQRDEARPKLGAKAVETRREAVAQLAWLAPLSDAELLDALADDAPLVRRAAAAAVARGEGRSVDDAVRARLAGDPLTSATQLAQWLVALRELGATDCTEVGLLAWRDLAQDEQVRVTGLDVATACHPERTVDDLRLALLSERHVDQLGAARALSWAPHTPENAAGIARGLASTSPDVAAAALRAVAAHRLSALTGWVEAARVSPSPEVRAEALLTLAELLPLSARTRAGEALLHDEAEQVRVAAAKALAVVGGPQAISALTKARNDDPSSRVKFVADDSLRRLGGGSVQ
jgi:HEAT repeats